MEGETRIFVCPYDDNHRVKYKGGNSIFARQDIEKHLSKCKCRDRKRDTDPYILCKYNPSHAIRTSQVESHHSICSPAHEDTQMTSFTKTNQVFTFKGPQQIQQVPKPMTESQKIQKEKKDKKQEEKKREKEIEKAVHHYGDQGYKIVRHDCLGIPDWKTFYLIEKK